MAAKKTPPKKPSTKTATKPAAAEPPKVPGIAGPVREGAELYLHPTDLARLEAAQLRAKSAEQAVELAAAKIRNFQIEAQAQIKASQEGAKKLVTEYEGQRAALLELYSRLELAYGVSMASVAYDATTGRINALPSA